VHLPRVKEPADTLNLDVDDTPAAQPKYLSQRVKRLGRLVQAHRRADAALQLRMLLEASAAIGCSIIIKSNLSSCSKTVASRKVYAAFASTIKGTGPNRSRTARTGPMSQPGCILILTR